MKHFAVIVGLLAAGFVAAAHAAEDAPPASSLIADLTHLHDFDFLVGDWNVRHRRLKERLADNHEWVEFDGSLSMRKLMDGRANVGDNLFKMPGGDHRGVGMRAYDPKTGEWSVWWLDGSNPSGNLDPPSKGHFEKGIGTFHADDTLRGKPVRVRVIWSQITPTSARWEQAYSADGGKTWETNWISDLKRASQTQGP